MNIRRFISDRAGGRAHISGLALAGLLLAALCAGDAANPSPQPTGKVNINQASAEQIGYLPRIGAKVAARVVDYRKTHGQFARAEDLMEVKGIGEKLFLTLKPYIAVSGPTTLAAKVHAGPSPSRKRGEGASPAKAPQTPAPAAASPGKGR